MIVQFVRDVIYETLPFPRLVLANRRVERGTPNADIRKQRWAGLGRTRLLALLDQEWERAKHLDDKLFKATTGLSVAVSAAGVASKTVLDSLPSGLLKMVITCLLLYAIASLFAGVIMGFGGLRPKQRPGYGPDFALKTRRDSPATGREIADALMHYEIKNLIVSNEATAANMAMRNGVIAFAIAMTASLFISAKNTEPLLPGNHFTTIYSGAADNSGPVQESAASTSESSVPPTATTAKASPSTPAAIPDTKSTPTNVPHK